MSREVVQGEEGSVHRFAALEPEPRVRYWGIQPSFGLLQEPDTNGVVERWNRTRKEQATYGRVLHNLADVRAAVAAFFACCNRCRHLEKLACRTPLEARERGR